MAPVWCIQSEDCDNGDAAMDSDRCGEKINNSMGDKLVDSIAQGRRGTKTKFCHRCGGQDDETSLKSDWRETSAGECPGNV